MSRVIPYSAAELSFVKSNACLTRRELTRLFNEKFNRELTISNIAGLCERNGWLTGRNGRFPKGNVSWNKGTSYQPGGRAIQSQFKKGHLPANTKHEGHERTTKDGYLMVSIEQTNPHTGFHRRYVLKHRWVWEQANGPVPEGMCLKFKDANRQNCDINNLELIDRALLPVLMWSGYDDADPSVKPLIMASCKLMSAIKSVTRSGD